VKDIGSTTHLRRIREYELQRVLDNISLRGRLLEIGAGSGWQAKVLSEHEFDVKAIDIADSEYSSSRVWPVIVYDGVVIPFPDQSFDIVFSSNVLEHIVDLYGFQKEIQRVLKQDGLAIHVLPTASWRFWTNIAYYINALKRIFSTVKFTSTNEAAPAAKKFTSDRSLFKRILIPSRHGERGNSMSEMYYFSRFHWRRLFRKTGWTIVRSYSAELFYTGYALLNVKLSLRARRFLSRFLGSACYIYVLKREVKERNEGK